MSKTILVFLITTLFLLSGCEGEVRAYSYADRPHLTSFNIIDSDGISSESNVKTLVIDPYTDSGYFDVYWYASSAGDYHSYLSINDRPDERGSILIHSEHCGPGLICDLDGSILCQYTPDFYMGCGLDTLEIDHNLTPIDILITNVPDTLYLIFEICNVNGFDCEMDSIPVRAY